MYRNRKPVRMETRRLTKNGCTLDVLLSAAVIEGHRKRTEGMMVNITERKRLEGSSSHKRWRPLEPLLEV
ncbi:MAG: hypothetical protein SWO11_05555 [Thermodesulfobacteriota bacterium]|nr:hypothetical protein [Thermodesulfobacteriota bacterium]